MRASAAILLSTESPAGYYIHWGVIQISLTNMIIIAAMVVTFMLAILLPFPGHGRDHRAERKP